MPSSVPPPLTLADRWARELGKTTRLMELLDSDGSKGVVLLIVHRDHRIFIQARGECIVVTVLIEIPTEVTAAIARQSAPMKRRIEVNLRTELASNGRTAFTLRPAAMTDIEQLRRITVEQLMKVSEDDPSSFNRLADAIQEVVTTAARASAVLTPFLPTEEGAQHGPDDLGFPSNMYA